MVMETKTAMIPTATANVQRYVTTVVTTMETELLIAMIPIATVPAQKFAMTDATMMETAPSIVRIPIARALLPVLKTARMALITTEMA